MASPTAMQAARRAVAEDEAGNLSAAMANYKTAVELMLPALGALPESHRGPVRAQVERYLARAEELKVQVVAAAAAAPPPAAQPQAESSGGGAVEEEIARCITMFPIVLPPCPLGMPTDRLAASLIPNHQEVVD